MRRLLLMLLLVAAPLLLAQTDSTGGSAAHGAETTMHKQAHPDEPPHEGGGGHTEKTYFGIPGWILKIANMLLFIGVLVYFVGGPVKKAFATRTEAIRAATVEARERREKSDRMAGEIQARLAAIEAEVRAIHERAEIEGERQKRELIVATEAESQKMLAAARNEVENRLKHARTELTEFAGQLASERAEAILRDQITEQDQKKLFQESLHEVSS
jgi:F-type H+-transporting ATPase subunit b